MLYCRSPSPTTHESFVDEAIEDATGDSSLPVDYSAAFVLLTRSVLDLPLRTGDDTRPDFTALTTEVGDGVRASDGTGAEVLTVDEVLGHYGASFVASMDLSRTSNSSIALPFSERTPSE